MINNNDIMKKLRVALKLKDTDIIDILKYSSVIRKLIAGPQCFKQNFVLF